VLPGVSLCLLGTGFCCSSCVACRGSNPCSVPCSGLRTERPGGLARILPRGDGVVQARVRARNFALAFPPGHMAAAPSFELSVLPLSSKRASVEETEDAEKMNFLAAIRGKSQRLVALSCDAHLVSSSQGRIQQPCVQSSDWDQTRANIFLMSTILRGKLHPIKCIWYI